MRNGIEIEVSITMPIPQPEPEPATPPDIPHRMEVGATYDIKDYEQYLATFPLTRSCRVFSSTHAPLWTDKRIKALVDAGKVPFISWKTHDLAATQSWLDTMPSEPVLPKVYATWMHEPEPKGVNPDQYKRYITEQHTLIKGHPNGKRIQFGPVLTRQWTENTRGRTYEEYDPGIGDFLGCDMYANTWEDRYPSPIEFTRYFGLYASKSGRPMWVPEIGAVLMASDPDGTKRAPWITEVFKELYGWGTHVAVWWCDMGTTASDGASRNFKLDDQPSREAFQAVLAQYNGS